MTTLAAQGITAGYGARTVLRECDLSVSSRELVAVVGPNGAGKSTLLRILCGLLRPTAGRVLLDGAEIAGSTRRDIARRIAVVPQILETLFPFTVREVVALGRTARLGPLGRPTFEDVRVIESVLRTLELSAVAGRRIDALSGGERQRAVLAMALAQEAEILLLDEPTVHLDPGHQIATLELVRSLARDRGLAVVAVLHDLNLAAAFASRIAVLAGGRISHDGPPAMVLTDETVAGAFGPRLRVLAGEPPAVLPRPSAPTS